MGKGNGAATGNDDDGGGGGSGGGWAGPRRAYKILYYFSIRRTAIIDIVGWCPGNILFTRRIRLNSERKDLPCSAEEGVLDGRRRNPMQSRNFRESLKDANESRIVVTTTVHRSRYPSW